jgi:hypothetical protein
LSLALHQRPSAGPFPAAFQKPGSGFIPDLLGAIELRIALLLIGCAVTLALIEVEVRGGVS